MSLRLPEGIELPKAGLFEALGQGLGSGIEAGAKTTLSNMLKMNERQKQTDIKTKDTRNKSAMTFSSDLNKYAKEAGIDLEGMDAAAKTKLILDGEKRILAGEDPLSVISESMISTSPKLKKALGLELSEEEQQQVTQDEEKSKPFSRTLTPFDPEKRTFVKDIAAVDKYMKDVEEKQKNLTFMEKLKGNTAIMQNMFSGLSMGVIPKKELPENYQHMEQASNLIKEVSSFMPMGGMLNLGKNLGTKAALKLFPKAAVAAKILGAFGGASGGTLFSTISKTTENKELPSAREVMADFAKWSAFEAAFAAMPLIKSVTSKNVKEFAEKTGATQKEAAEYLNGRVKAKPSEGIASETAEKASLMERQTGKAEIGKEQLKEQRAKLKAKARKAAKSPATEEVFAEKEIVNSRPETIAKKEMQVAEVEERMKPIKRDIKESGKQLTDLEMQKRRVTSAVDKKAIQESIERTRWHNKELTKELRDLEFERKYGKKPLSKPEMAQEIDKSMEKLREQISDPTPLDAKQTKQAARTLELNEKAIERAESILKRNELLSSEQVDYYTRLKRQYSDAYRDMIKANERMVDDLLGKKTSGAKKQISELEQMNKTLKQRRKRAEADLVIQRNKRELKKLGEGAKGAFFKKELAKLKIDNTFLQKSLFKQNKIKASLELKTEQAVKETISNLSKNPTEANARKTAEAQGVSYEGIQQDAKNLIKETEGESLESIRKKASGKGFVNKYAKNKAIGAFIVGINSASRALLGFGLPQRLLGSLVAKAGFKGAATSGYLVYQTLSLLNKGAKAVTDKGRATELSKLKDTVAYSKYIKGLKEKGLSAKRIKKIREKAKAA